MQNEKKKNNNIAHSRNSEGVYGLKLLDHQNIKERILSKKMGSCLKIL